MADDILEGDTPGHIAALITSRNNSAGDAIREFYACNPPYYAVYRTDTRVMIDFADKGATETLQRAKLAPLGPLRSEINGLINGWRGSRDHRKLAKARTFDRRTADALVMALEDSDNAVLFGALCGGIGGVAGSFYSIATGLSKRTILTDLQQRDNAQDAVLRMLIGVISAGIVICVLRAGVGCRSWHRRPITPGCNS